MALVFEILDELIMDLESDDIKKHNWALYRIEELYRYTQNKLQSFEIKQKAHSTEYYTNMYYGYRRIINRLYDGNIKEAITMMRELQDDLHRPVFTKYDDSRDKRYTQAWHRFEDWKVESLYEQQF